MLKNLFPAFTELLPQFAHARYPVAWQVQASVSGNEYSDSASIQTTSVSNIWPDV